MNPQAKLPSTAERRVLLHITDKDKRFRENLTHSDGWVEVSMAREIQFNDWRLDDDALQDERVLEAVESDGVIASMDYFNLHNKR